MTVLYKNATAAAHERLFSYEVT